MIKVGDRLRHIKYRGIGTVTEKKGKYYYVNVVVDGVELPMFWLNSNVWKTDG